MYRSISTNRVSDDYFNHHNHNSSPPSSKASPALRALSLEAKELPEYEPLWEVAKKERGRLKFAENAVHLIPLVLILCAFILWFFSNPDVDVPMKGDSIAARIEGLTIEGDVDTQTGILPGVELGDLDSARKDDDDNNKASNRSL